MFSIIVAVDRCNAIGYKGHLLCSLRSDMLRFKKITTGHVVIMGHKTYLSLPLRPLPNRTNIVITQNTCQDSDVIVAHSMEEVDALLRKFNLYDEENFIIGGGQIYEAFFSISDKLYITHIDNEWKEADTFFPHIGKEWRKNYEERFIKNSDDAFDSIFAIYHRIKPIQDVTHR